MSPGARVQQAGEVDAQLIVPGQPQPNILATGVSKAGVAGSNPAGGTNVSAVQTVFSRVPKSRWLSGGDPVSPARRLLPPRSPRPGAGSGQIVRSGGEFFKIH